jgi:polyhydroxybutyrate depolymerase
MLNAPLSSRLNRRHFEALTGDKNGYACASPVMKPSSRWSIASSIVGLSLAVAAGCSQSSGTSVGTGGSGTGGAIGSGGSPGSGGSVGAGGAPVGTGGAGTGGVSPSSGGSMGTGGASPGSGGSMGTGGANPGTGGAAVTGGVPAAGGTSSSGGTTSGTGGVTGRGGTTTAPVQGGAAGSTSVVPDAGSTGGRDAATTPGTGGSGSGGAGGTGGATADGGAASAGCGTAINRPNPKTQQTIDIGGTTRYYLLDVPSAADNKTPLMLIFALHGYDMNNVSVVGLYNFTSRSNGKAITVYPQGEGPAPGDTSHWGDGVLKSTWTANTANYDFMQTLKADLESRFCIDTNKVFFTGFSMGGMFTNSIACEHSDWFHGFAPVEGMGPGSCANKNAKPAIIIHQGTADTTVSPTSGGEPTRDFWTQQNGCNTTTTSTLTGCTSYGACAEPVLYCVGNWNHTISSTATANIWTFFSTLP